MIKIDKSLASKKERIFAYVTDKLRQYKVGKSVTDRLAYTSILFYRGEQWITFDTAALKFRRTNQRRALPRPVTNKFAPTCNSLVSAYSRFDPKIICAPQSDSQEDMNTALLANKVIRTIELETGMEKRQTELRPWLVITGNAFLITGWDSEGGPIETKIKGKCPTCGYKDFLDSADDRPGCPVCSQDEIPSILQPQVTTAGNVVTEDVPQGQMRLEVANVFEMFVDYRIPDIQDQPIVIRIHAKDVEWARQMWPEIASKIEPGKKAELSVRMNAALGGPAYTVGTASDETSVDIVEVWCKGTKEFPDGFYLIYSGTDLIHELHKYPFSDVRGRKFYPIVHFAYDKIPGTFLARTPAFDLIDKQKTRNRVESIGEMILMRMSNPVWIRPVPGTVSMPTGQVGQVIDYDPNQTGNQAPTRVEASQMSPAITHWLDRIDNDFIEIAGLSEILQGKRPLSAKSGTAYSKLQEIAENRNVGPYTNYSIAMAEWQIIAFEIFRKVSPPERYFRIMNEESSWTVGKLQEADMKGGIDIWAEPGASLPKGYLEELATLELLTQMGLVDTQDPIQRLKIFRKYGMSGILPALDADDQYISREHDRFKRGGSIAVSPYDNHAQHLDRHLIFWKSEYFETLPQEMRTPFLEHIAEHQTILQQQQQQQLEQQLAMQGVQ